MLSGDQITFASCRPVRLGPVICWCLMKWRVSTVVFTSAHLWTPTPSTRSQEKPLYLSTVRNLLWLDLWPPVYFSPAVRPSGPVLNPLPALCADIDAAVVTPKDTVAVGQGKELKASCNALSSLQTHTVWFKVLPSMLCIHAPNMSKQMQKPGKNDTKN